MRAKKMIFFFENIVESFHIFLVILMILFTAEPLRFFIYISVCCWTFELSLLLNLWDYLLLLNLWIFFTAEPLRLCPGLCICLLLNLWILFTTEPLRLSVWERSAVNKITKKWTLNKTSWIRNYRYFYHPCKDLKR